MIFFTPLPLESPTTVGDSSGKVTLPRAFSMREGVMALKYVLNTNHR